MDRVSKQLDNLAAGVDNSWFGQSDRAESELTSFKFKIERPKLGDTPQSIIANEQFLYNGNEDSAPHQERADINEINFRRAPFRSDRPSSTEADPRRFSQIPSASRPNSVINSIYENQDSFFINNQPPGNVYLLPTNMDVEKTKFDETPSAGFHVLRIISAMFIIWDSIADWLVILRFDNYPCGGNPLLDSKFYEYDICGIHRETIRQVLAVFSLFGTIFGLIQVINIILIILNDKGKVKFKLFNPLTEVYISIFLEEIPQAVTLVVFMYNCDCSKPAKMFFIIMLASGFVSAAFRYATSFPALCGNNGCCNIWWRCCCCKDTRRLCHLTGQDCFCRCTIPCPLCCCTVACDDCAFTAHTWMASLYKTLSCFCGCCDQEEDSSYGIKLLDNLGLLCLLACLIAGAVLVGLTGWT